jgi:hypothetical protein
MITVLYESFHHEDAVEDKAPELVFFSLTCPHVGLVIVNTFSPPKFFVGNPLRECEGQFNLS